MTFASFVNRTPAAVGACPLGKVAKRNILRNVMLGWWGGGQPAAHILQIRNLLRDHRRGAAEARSNAGEESTPEPEWPGAIRTQMVACPIGKSSGKLAFPLEFQLAML